MGVGSNPTSDMFNTLLDGNFYEVDLKASVLFISDDSSSALIL